MSQSSCDQDRPLLEALAGASQADSAAEAAPDIELFCMRVAGVPYGLEPDLVHEVIHTPPITPLPGAPEFLVGVAAHRGEVHAVIDLARLLARGETARNERSRMAIARVDGMAVGLLAEQITGLRRFPAGARQPAPLGGSAAHQFTAAVVLAEPGPAFNLLDLRRALAFARERAVVRGNG